MAPHHSLFRDETKLDINYVPNRMPHREKEHRLLMEFFSFVLHNPEKMAQRVIITGDVGTGKTALAQRFGQDIMLEAHKTGAKIRYLHVNSRECRGKLSFVLQQVIAAFQPNFPKRGYAAEEQFNVLIKTLDEENTHLILALDEFDSIIEQEGSESVYQLTRLQETRLNQPQRVSLVCILRDLQSTEQLDASSKSTLQHNVIHLEKYSSRELVDILSERVRLAFQPDAVSEDIINLASELSSNESGNARFAIELLWRAGKYADAEQLESIIPECIRKAFSNIIPTMRRSELTGLELHEKLFLLGAARIFKESQRVYATLSEVEKEYALVCENFNIQPNGHTQLWKYVQFFSKLGVLKSQIVVAGPKGRTTQLSLPAISASELEKVIEQSIDSQKVISDAD